MRELTTSSAIMLVAVIGGAQPAVAQNNGAASGPSAAQDDQGLSDIVVTAQKRVEDGQKAPLAVTVVSAEMLDDAHISGATDLQRVIPNLTAQNGGGAGDPGGSNTVFTIRGLGASATGPQGSSGVAVHFDGVYQQGGISNSEFYDLERVEVDPGPQGTLYGRSAAAGAINVIPSKPTTDRVRAAGSISYGNYDALTTQGMVNIPLGDTSAVRLAFQTQDRDGFYSNGYDALHAVSARAQLSLKPTDPLSVRVMGNYTRLRGRGAGNVFVGGQSFPGLTSLLPQAGDRDLRRASISNYCFLQGVLREDCVQNIVVEKIMVQADIGYDFGGAILTVTPAYNRLDRDSTNANAPLPLSNYRQSPYDNEQVNVEARLSDGGGAFKWVIGGNYYRNAVDTRVEQFINVAVPGIPLPTPPFPPSTVVTGLASSSAFQQQKSRQESYAAFAQGTYPVTDEVRLTLGARYNWDESSGRQVLGNLSNVLYVIGGFPPLQGRPLQNLLPAPIVTPEQTGSASFKAFTYRVAVDADIGPASMVYASVGSGYKPGGLNDGGPISSTTPASSLAPEQFFGPEKVTHIELGSKNRFLGNTLQVNVTAYYDDYSNYQNGQTQVVNPLQFGTLGFVVTNAGQARIYGAEMAVKWQATSNDLFEISANYLDAKFTSYVSPAFSGPGGPQAAQDFSGFRLPNAPRVSGNISYQHIFDLAGGARVVASGFSRLTSGYYVFFTQAPGTYQKAHTTTTLDLTYRAPDDRYQISAFVVNLEDRDVKVSGGSTAGFTQVGLAPPRTYGVRVGFTF